VTARPYRVLLTGSRTWTDTPIAHGYTLHDLDHITRLVLRLDRWHNATDLDDRHDTIRFAITEHLLTATEPPTRSALFTTGVAASDARVRDEMRTHGRCTRNIGQPMPRFHAYWNPANPPSPEARVVDRAALDQIWPQLRPREQHALTALAATGDYEKAAAALGVTTGTFRVLISSGRRRFLTWWHEGETPSRLWRTDRRVRSRDGRDHLGRQRLTAAQIDTYRERHQAGETFTALAAECGLTPHALSALVRGKTKPAEEVAA
jgi:hypothetical protein